MPIIKVKNISKKYNIVHQKSGSSYIALRDVLTNFAKHPFKSAKNIMKQKLGIGIEEFWALKDINFSVEKGEVLGIIGPNGAGKSTLLKILSQITPPTTGEIKMKGRVGSLLEVGTGFNPELTGRENVYLNGAILGMTKKEISDKFNDIVEFSGVEKFIDTPVKRYSSGMKVRLGFSIAAHLEPDILLVDEVLAVGDVEFQKKCLGKMDEVTKKAGRTILFVSHNMAAIQNLCKRCILLNSGKIAIEGSTSSVIRQYLGLGKDKNSEISWKNSDSAPGDATVRLRSVRILSESGKSISKADIDKDILIELSYWNLKKDAKLLPSIHLVNDQGITVLTTSNMPSANLKPDPWYKRPSPKGLFRSVCRIPGNFLNEGLYFLNVFVASRAGIITSHVIERQIISFDVVETGEMRKEYIGKWIGVVRPWLDWNTKYQGPLK